MIEGFWLEAPPVEIRAIMENFCHNLWARHGWSVTLRYMAGQVTQGAPGGLRPGSLSGGLVLHPEPTGAPQPSEGPLLRAITPRQ